LGGEERWQSVRRIVNGGLNGWPEFWWYVQALANLPIEDAVEQAPLPPPDPRAVLARARLEDGKPYSGPIVGEPDSYRWGEPGWDCSSLVAGLYREFGLTNLVGYTDTLYDQSDPISAESAVPGDLWFPDYDDAQAARWPHVGFWTGDPNTVFDARFGQGVGEHPILPFPYELRRVKGAVAVTPAPEVDKLQGLLTAVAHLSDVTIGELEAKADDLENVAQSLLKLSTDLRERVKFAKDLRESAVGPRP
jgi:hypothetical protein